MRKMLTKICFILCLGSLLVPNSGRAQTGDNEFGLYAGPISDPASVNIEAVPGVTQFDFFFLLTNPVNHDFNGGGISRPVTILGGWEAKIILPTGFYIISAWSPPQTVLEFDGDDMVVTSSSRIPVQSPFTVLARFGGIVVDPAPKEVYLGLTDFPAIPGAMAYVDAEDPRNSWGSHVPAYPSSGSFDAPVFSVNSPGSVVATENESWGSVKSLFR